MKYVFYFDSFLLEYVNFILYNTYIHVRNFVRAVLDLDRVNSRVIWFVSSDQNHFELNIRQPRVLDEIMHLEITWQEE